MPGDYWQKFAGLRAFFAYWMAHPGKKLLFMGSEFAQFIEWNYDESLDWHLAAEYPMHAKMQAYSKALNAFYCAHKPFWEIDFEWDGFEWINCSDSENSVITFVRKAENPADYIIAVCNFTPVVRYDYRIGVPEDGEYEEIFNSDAAAFGGSNVCNTGSLAAQNIYWQERKYSISLTLPPLATIYLRCRGQKKMGRAEMTTGGAVHVRALDSSPGSQPAAAETAEEIPLKKPTRRKKAAAKAAAPDSIAQKPKKATRKPAVRQKKAEATVEMEAAAALTAEKPKQTSRKKAAGSATKAKDAAVNVKKTRKKATEAAEAAAVVPKKKGRPKKTAAAPEQKLEKG